MNAVIDRVVQYPNRWKITNVDTGEVLGTFDFVPEVGTITQVGTKINKELFDSIKEDIEAKISSDGGDASKAIETFTASNTRTNLVSGETISISMGKIYKWLSDLKALAFKDSLGKADVGLGNVDNTSDKDKPVSDKTQTALDNEAKARGNADKTIQDNISNEVTARTNADTALGERIDTERNTANNEYVKNMLHLGYYDTYTIDTNGNYVVTRQTGYLHITADAPILSLEKLQNGNPELWYSAPGAIFDTASTTDNIKSNWLALGNGTQYQGNYTSVASYYTSQPIVIVSVADATTADQIKTYVSSHPLFIQYKLATSYTETYEPNHFARIEPYALEHAKSEADRSSNLCNTFDRSNIPSTSSLYSATLNPDGSYTSTAIGDYRAWSYSNSDFKFDLEPGTYTLSSIITSSAYMNIFDSNNNGLPHVFTLTSRTSVGIMVKAFTGSAYIMLNRGSVALPYQPYEGKTVHETGLTKSAVGLSNVDNTADKDKPVSTATQAALKKAQGVTIKVFRRTNASRDFFDVFFLNQYTSPVHSTVIKLELKNAVSLSLQSTYGFAKPILTKAVLVQYGSDYENRYPLVISGLSKRSSDYTAYDGDDYEMFSISEMLYSSLTGASDITGTSDWYFLFTFEEME
jgi:hypothetical protein